MNEPDTECKTDLLSSRWGVLLWRVPLVLVVFGMFFGGIARTVLWTVGFTASGVACLVNARRCGRLHCYYTGPLFLLLAAGSLLYGLHVLPRGAWQWTVGVAVVGSVAARLLEWRLGRYTSRHSAQ